MSGRGPVAKVLVERLGPTGPRRGPDELVVEEPMEIRLDGHRVATTMRTPGHDFELAAGFCFGDGLLTEPADTRPAPSVPVQTIRYCGTGSALETEFNVVTVETGGAAGVPEPRLGNVSSSCGLCGSTAIDDLREHIRPLPRSEPFDMDAVVAAGAAVADHQPLFDRTGSVHGAAAFDRAGRPLVVREDIGRHNAVDKVVGRLLLDGRLPAADLGLWVSGRASFELVTKAWHAGFGLLAAVSGPSALAVEAATAGGLTLAGFARGEALNVYAGALAEPGGSRPHPNGLRRAYRG